MSSITTSESARAAIHTEAALGAAGSNSASPSNLRMASLGLCPNAESSPSAKACAMNRLRLSSTRYRMSSVSSQRAHDDSHAFRSHRGDADIPLDVRKHFDHSGSDDGQRRAADDFPHQMIRFLPAANAEGIYTYIESHCYQPLLRKRVCSSAFRRQDSNITK